MVRSGSSFAGPDWIGPQAFGIGASCAAFRSRRCSSACSAGPADGGADRRLARRRRRRLRRPERRQHLASGPARAPSTSSSARNRAGSTGPGRSDGEGDRPEAEALIIGQITPPAGSGSRLWRGHSRWPGSSGPRRCRALRRRDRPSAAPESAPARHRPGWPIPAPSRPAACPPTRIEAMGQIDRQAPPAGGNAVRAKSPRPEGALMQLVRPSPCRVGALMADVEGQAGHGLSVSACRRCRKGKFTCPATSGPVLTCRVRRAPLRRFSATGGAWPASCPQAGHRGERNRLDDLAIGPAHARDGKVAQDEHRDMIALVTVVLR